MWRSGVEERSAEKGLWTLSWRCWQCIHIPSTLQTDWPGLALVQSCNVCRVVS